MKGRGIFVLAVGAVLAAAWIFAGCGSSGDSGTTASATEKSTESAAAEVPSGPLTKSEFVQAADQICRKGAEKKEKAVLSVAKLATESGGPPSSKALEKLATVVIFPSYSEILDQLSQLEGPASDKATIDRMIEKYEADLEAAEASPVKATKVNMFADANDAGKAYGLSCRF